MPFSAPEAFGGQGRDVLGMQALGPCTTSNVTGAPWLQRPETFHLDGRKVSEHVRAAAFGLDEAKPFGVVEPFHSTACHIYLLKLCTNGQPILKGHTRRRQPAQWVTVEQRHPYEGGRGWACAVPCAPDASGGLQAPSGRGLAYNPGMISVQAISMMADRSVRDPRNARRGWDDRLERDTVALSPRRFTRWSC